MLLKFVVLYFQFLADIEVFVETIVVLVDEAHATIDRRHKQGVEQMPLGTTEIVG